MTRKVDGAAAIQHGEPPVCWRNANRNATRTRGPSTTEANRESLGDSREPAHSIGTWTKETPTDGFLNERERLLGLTCFGFGCLRTELHRRQPIFGSFDTRLSLRQSSRRVLQLALGLRDEFKSCPLGSFGSNFGEF